MIIQRSGRLFSHRFWCSSLLITDSRCSVLLLRSCSIITEQHILLFFLSRSSCPHFLNDMWSPETCVWGSLWKADFVPRFSCRVCRQDSERYYLKKMAHCLYYLSDFLPPVLFVEQISQNHFLSVQSTTGIAGNHVWRGILPLPDKHWSEFINSFL